VALGAALVTVLVFAGKSAFSDGILDSGKPGSILTDSQTGPCTPDLAGADVVNGTDVDGDAVPQADLARGSIPMGGQIAVPLGPRKAGASTARAPAYVAVDGAKLDPLLNPKSSCK
jgi:hypothetical protein